MAFPLGAVLAAAPSVISAAADIIRVIKEKKTKNVQPEPESQRLDEMTSLIERQAELIEELALNNSNLALAVRNNRILAVISLAVGVVAVVLSVSF
jgi:hypothetical protein